MTRDEALDKLSQAQALLEQVLDDYYPNDEHGDDLGLTIGYVERAGDGIANDDD